MTGISRILTLVLIDLADSTLTRHRAHRCPLRELRDGAAARFKSQSFSPRMAKGLRQGLRRLSVTLTKGLRQVDRAGLTGLTCGA